jgi:hypothetical protein
VKAGLAKQLAAKLKTINTERMRKVRAIAKTARTALLPYFREHQLTFGTGNGIWYVSARDGRFIEDEDLPPAISGLLLLEIDHEDAFGLHIDNITRADWK